MAGPGEVGRFWAKVSRDRFYRDSAWVTLGLFSFNVSNYALNVALSRMLGKDRFGEVASVLSVLFLFVLPAQAVQTFLTREAAQLDGIEGVRTLYIRFRNILAVTGISAVIIGLAAAPYLRSFLRLPSVLPAILLPPILAIGLAVPVYRGLLQGRRRFQALAANLAAEATLRLVVSIALVAAGYATVGVLGGFAVGMLVALGLGRYASRSELRAAAGTDQSDVASVWDFVLMFLGIGLLNAQFNIDVILARHFLPGQSGGEYAALSLMARVLFYLTAAVSGVVLASNRLSQPSQRRQLLAKGLAAVLALPLAGEVLFIAAASPLMSVVFGTKYSAAASSLPILGIGMLGLAVANILIYFLMALRRPGWIWLLVITLILEAGLIVWRHSSVGDISAAFTVASLTGMAGLALLVSPTLRKARAATP